MAIAGDVETVDHQEDDEDNIESSVIRIFDARGGSSDRREIHSYEEMHSDSITALHFLDNELLLSAGLDHLINCIDVQQGDSDLALLSTQRVCSL